MQTGVTETLDSLWDDADAPAPEGAAEIAAAALNAAIDERCHGEEDTPASMPTWPPRVQSARPAISNHESVRRRRKRAVHFREPQDVSPHPKSKKSEGVAARTSRSLQGVAYDLKHWDNIQPPSETGRLEYIVTRDGRGPVMLGVFVCIAVLITVLLLRRCSPHPTEINPLLNGLLSSMSPQEQAKLAVKLAAQS